MMKYSSLQLILFFYLYAFLGWCMEALIYGTRGRRAVNPGILTLPMILNYGATMVVLVTVLPSFGKDVAGQFVFTLIVSALNERLSTFLAHRIAPGVVWPDRKGLFHAELKGFIAALLFAGAYLLAYHIVHPVVLTLVLLMPGVLKLILCVALIVLSVADLILTAVSVRRGDYAAVREGSRSARANERITGFVWKRVQNAYPGIREMTKEQAAEAYTFAAGMSLDKVVWVFFSVALLGDMIETVYCGLVNGEWMNRSSVLYGPFSFVWGIGAVCLTVALLPLAKRNDRWVFAGGFLIGGAFEYACSVFTEVVFGTVFWDYSYMPLNINGRTNVLFCFFWGVLGLAWIKLIYPFLAKQIERIPPLAGKLITWVLVITMALNAGVTMAAMLRFNARKEDPTAHNMLEELLDTHYPDEVIHEHWPNMIVVEDKEGKTEA